MNKLTNNCKGLVEKIKKFKLLIITIILIVQLLIPASMIYSEEIISIVGDEISLEIEPVDPYDYFRGRYLSIRPIETKVVYQQFTQDLKDELRNRATSSSSNYFYDNIKCYITFKKGQDGMHTIDQVTFEKPKNTRSYLKATINNIWESNGKEIHVNYSMNQFFINEDFALKSEDTIRNLPQGTKAYIKAKINDGDFVIENLYVGDKNIYEYLK
ncbi:MAG TPA: hypothetical protein DCP90_04445 [Clostridiales bacterium]|nr:MAG: hypothetical protein A2Y22_06820 [Clostridiales bacterium GWD2_32_59]HAN09845.1 hypothetical protein [Clostridiales bacterium]